MRLIRKFGTSFTLLAALGVATWSIGCGQNTGTKAKDKTSHTKQDHSKLDAGKQKKTTDGKKKKDEGPVIPGTIDTNPDGVGSGTGSGIKLDDLDN